jgi:uncharacterized protein
MDKLKNKIIELYKEYVPGHDLKHALRVAGLAKKIAEKEKHNIDEAVAAALVHDIGRTCQEAEEFHAKAGLKIVRESLNNYTDLSKEAIERVIDAVSQHSNKTSSGKLANILQDADKLDGMGAIGVVRGFVSKHNIPDYDPELKINDFNDGRKVNSLVAQLRLQMEWHEMLYTESAKEMAGRRMSFMEEFLKELALDIQETETD